MLKQRRTARRIALPSPRHDTAAVSRRSVLAGGAATLAQLGSTVIAPQAIAEVKPAGKMVLAWHTNIAARWLDPQQHDGTASPDNFLMALHDGLIKNFRDELYDHPALAERYEFAEDAKSATFWLRPGTKFHDGTPVTPADVKWSYEHYRGAWGEVLQSKYRKASRSSTTTPSGSTSRSRSSTSRSCWEPPTSAAPAGWCRRNTTNRSGRPGSCRSRSAPVPTSWSRSSRA